MPSCLVALLNTVVPYFPHAGSSIGSLGWLVHYFLDQRGVFHCYVGDVGPFNEELSRSLLCIHSFPTPLCEAIVRASEHVCTSR